MVSQHPHHGSGSSPFPGINARPLSFADWLARHVDVQLSMTELVLLIETYPRMTETQAADFLGCSIKALQKWRVEGDGPAFVKGGAMVRYRLRDLLAWESQRLASSTSDSRRR